MNWKFGLPALMAILLASQADGRDAPAGDSFEVSLTGGYRTSGTFNNGFNDADPDFAVDWEMEGGLSLGGILDYRVSDRWDLSMLVIGQSTKFKQSSGRTGETDIDVNTAMWHIGAKWRFPQENWTPYAMGGLGVYYASPKNNFDTETRFSVHLGAGARKFISDTVAIRADARAFAVDVHADDSVFCDENGFCYNFKSGNWMIQGDFQAGLTLAF